MQRDHSPLVLSPSDPDPIEEVNPDGSSSIVLVCEHAGRLIPSVLGDLGVDESEMERHIAYDVGAANLSRRLSALLDAPLLMQRYSRLVVDCNRPFQATDCFPPVSDGTSIPANADLSRTEREARYEEIHVPFHGRLASVLRDRRSHHLPTVLVSIHSFTRKMRSTGDERRCDLGLLYNREPSFAEALMNEVRAAAPQVRSVFNEPYGVDDESDYTIPVHGEAQDIPHVLIEVVNDGIASDRGQSEWAELLAPALRRAAANVVGDSSER